MRLQRFVACEDLPISYRRESDIISAWTYQECSFRLELHVEGGLEQSFDPAYTLYEKGENKVVVVRWKHSQILLLLDKFFTKNRVEY